tara:strand:- start:125 stop:1054 length:930 start_codon:yes stop_codon:yes gene_type:complete
VKVSIAVISYNSEKTILSTLDSILGQDYDRRKIELVISDDASRDATVEIAQNWLKEYGSSFDSTKLIVNSVNSGVSANYNNASKACTSEWIKIIAADDILKENCLSSNISFIINEPRAQIVFSYIECFGDATGIIPYASQLDFFSLDAKEQNNVFRYFSFNVAPSQFIKKSLLQDVGFANEDYRLMEDCPLWLKITASGVRLYFNEVVTVKYRVANSISKAGSKFINRDFVKCCLLINKNEKKEVFPSFGFFLKLEEQLILRYKLFLSYILGNRRTVLHKILFNMIWFFTPLNLFYRGRERMLRIRSYN